MMQVRIARHRATCTPIFTLEFSQHFGYFLYANKGDTVFGSSDMVLQKGEHSHYYAEGSASGADPDGDCHDNEQTPICNAMFISFSPELPGTPFHVQRIQTAPHRQERQEPAM